MTPALLHALYAFAGLFVGLIMTGFGVFLAIRRVVTNRRWCVKFGQFEIKDADIGIAFAILGVLVIYLTRL
jgi:uncharacterized membrane protein